MKLERHQRSELGRNLQKALADSDFRTGTGWLTYYLNGNSEVLSSAALELGKLGLSNLDGTDSGFLYAKQPTDFEEMTIIEKVELVASVCAMHSVNVGPIDLDTDEDVEKSKFHTLLTLD